MAWRSVSAWLRTRAAGDALWLLAGLLLIWAVYVFIVSAGHGDGWHLQMRFHDLQAEGFRNGQLSAAYDPHPALLSADNPYDIKNLRYWLRDLSYYEGRYYLYWGPVPGAILALAKTLFRVNEPVGDSVLAFGFFSLLSLAGGVLIVLLCRRLFPSLPRAVVISSVFVFALATPLPHGVASGSVYVASIAGGQAFLWLGMLAGFNAVWSGPGVHAWRGWLCGLCFAVAIGCRVSLAPAVALLGLLVALFAGPRGRGLRTLLRTLPPIAVPCLAAVGALLVYNRLRFDRFLEFGIGVQLSAWKFRGSLDYVLANLQSYLFRSWEPSCHFPYLLQGRGIAQRGPWDWLPVPNDYATVSPMVGVLLALPILWFAPACVASLLKRRAALQQGDRRSRVLLFCALCFAVLGSVTGFPELGLNVATMRYITDVSSGLVLLGLLGAWTLLEAALPRAGNSKGRRWFGLNRDAAPRVATLLVVGGLSLATILVGLLLGYQGYNHHFRTHNPALHQKLADSLSLCSPAR